jgi:hypothetical protein
MTTINDLKDLVSGSKYDGEFDQNGLRMRVGKYKINLVPHDDLVRVIAHKAESWWSIYCTKSDLLSTLSLFE